MKQLTHLMEKEMSRKEFLATMGFGIVSILGFSSMLKFLFDKGGQHNNASMGYGSNIYGGRKS